MKTLNSGRTASEIEIPELVAREPEHEEKPAKLYGLTAETPTSRAGVEEEFP
jgi:hypothetical protein